MDIKQRLNEILDEHRGKDLLTCPETCMCWDIEALLLEVDLNFESVPERAECFYFPHIIAEFDYQCAGCLKLVKGKK